MGNSDSTPLKPENEEDVVVQLLMQQLRVNTDKYEQKISNLKIVMEKMDELQRETERRLNEVKRELEEQKEQNRQNKAEIQRLKEGVAGKVENVSSNENENHMDETSKDLLSSVQHSSLPSMQDLIFIGRLLSKLL